MPNYKCSNKKCKSFNQVIRESNCHIIYKKEGKIDKTAPCPECGKDREMVVDGFCTSMHGGGNCCNR